MTALSPHCPHCRIYLILVTSLEAPAYFYLMAALDRGQGTKSKAHPNSFRDQTVRSLWKSKPVKTHHTERWGKKIYLSWCCWVLKGEKKSPLRICKNNMALAWVEIWILVAFAAHKKPETRSSFIMFLISFFLFPFSLSVEAELNLLQRRLSCIYASKN